MVLTISILISSQSPSFSFSFVSIFIFLQHVASADIADNAIIIPVKVSKQGKAHYTARWCVF